MVLSLLARHWLACIARSLRVLLFYRAHLRLLGLDVHRRYVTRAHDDVFHHLSHRHYLAKGLTLRERMRCVLIHYRFEEYAFDAAYKRAVYRDGGLPLWTHDAAGCPFAIRLEMASRLSAEGDLTISASAGGACLHRLSFSWVSGEFAGVDATILPFIARNQGHDAGAADAFDAFERAFPHNSPSFFCFAALQGIAQALGMDQVVAVKSAWQCAYDPLDAQHFANAYDGFWQTLGGVPMAGRGWRIALPLKLKSLDEMPSRHHGRASMRREHWHEIGDSARLALRRHLVHADT
jgi:uncharacterized protein VirK/YbjX